jgi:hypothetical protein
MYYLLCEKHRINNYFKSRPPSGSGAVATFWFFDCTNLKSVEHAFNDALASGKKFSVFRPFPIAGSWFGCDIVGYTHRPNVGIHSDEAEAERRGDMLHEWIETRALRMV